MRDVSLLTSATLLSTAISGVLGLLTARLLSPELFGIWQSMRLIQQYAAYPSLGVPFSMQREVARALAQGHRKAADRSVDVTFSFVTMITLAFAGLFLVSSVLTGWPFKPAWMLPLAAFVVASQSYGVLLMALAGHRRFGLSGLIDVLTSVANLGLTVALVIFYGLTGLLVAQVSWSVLGIALALAFGGLRPRFLVDWREVIAQARLGLQFTANGFLYLLTRSVDRLLILSMLGAKALGLYGTSLLAMGYVELAGTAVGRVVFPHIVVRFEARGEMSDIRGFVVRASVTLGAIGAACGGMAALLMPPAFQLILPRYTAALGAAQVLVLASSYLVVRSSIEYFFVAISKLYRTFPIQIAVTVAAAAGCWFAISAGYGLTGVAMVMFGAYLATSVGFTGYAFAHYEHDWPRVAWFLARVHLPAVYAGAVVFALERLLPLPGFGGDWLAMFGLRLVLYAFALTPWLLFARSRDMTGPVPAVVAAAVPEDPR
ncbi:MAG TPA: oligosaccharide flippase family protein [Candidatus Dormibacteraeota bacterium]|nr:oligosaccharide flippase family protein [Candidatus Dormibacteraeota bacterium]